MSYDLIAAAARQKVFHYQVALPHYQDRLFLEKSLKRYKQYLFLKMKKPDIFLVPCYDIDLLWHTHMSHPVCYKNVTELYLGTLLNHDDSVNDRSDGSRLNNSYAVTRQLWKTEFGESFSAYGAMYRGDPSVGKLNTVSQDTNFNMLSKQVSVQLDRVEVTGSRSQQLGKYKLHFIEKKEILLTGRYGDKEVVDMSEKLLVLKGLNLEWEKAGSFTKLACCIDSDNLCVKLITPKSFLCFNSAESCQGESKIEFNQISKKFVSCGQSISESVTLDLDEDLGVRLDMTLTLKKLGCCDLWLVPGMYEDCIMPEQAEQLWGPVPLPRLPDGVENKCTVASHK